MPKKGNNRKERSNIRDFLGLNDSPGQRKKGSPPPSRKTHFTIWYVVIAFLVIFLIQSYLTTQKANEISYSQFKELVRGNGVEELVITPQVIRGRIEGDEGIDQPGRLFQTVRVEDPELIKDLEKKGIQYRGKQENKWLSGIFAWVIPIIFFFK